MPLFYQVSYLLFREFMEKGSNFLALINDLFNRI